MCKKHYRGSPSSCSCENNRYLEGIVDDPIIVCDKIISVWESASTNVTNTVPANVTSTVSINSDDKKSKI